MRAMLSAVLGAALLLLGAAETAHAQAIYHTPSDFLTAAQTDPFSVEALQACATASGEDGRPCLLDAGVYDVPSRALQTSLGNPRSVMGLEFWRTKRAPTLRGAGVRATTIRMVGDGHGTDWWMIGCFESRGLTMENLRLDGSGRQLGQSSLHEQQHLFNGHYGCKQVTIRDVECFNPVLETGYGGSGGDCLRFVGNAVAPSGPPDVVTQVSGVSAPALSFRVTNVFGAMDRSGQPVFVELTTTGVRQWFTVEFTGGANRVVVPFVNGLALGQSSPSLVAADYRVGFEEDAYLVEDVLVENVQSYVGDRSTIGLQRAVHRATFRKIVSVGIGDQDFDMEATGVTADNQRIKDILIEDFVAIRTGGPAIAMGRGDRLRVNRATILNGTIFVLSCADCSVRNSVILTDDSTRPGIDVWRNSPDFLAEAVRVVRPTGATNSAAGITIMGGPDGVPLNARVRASHIVQTGDAPGVRANDASVGVTDSVLEYVGAVPAGVNSSAVSVTVTGVVAGPRGGSLVSQNRILGPWKNAVSLPAGTASVKNGPLRMIGNEVDGPANALVCTGHVTNPERFLPVVRGLNVLVPNQVDGSTATDNCPIATSGY